MSEYKQIQQKGEASGIAASPFHGRLNIWQACIFGPDETLWEGGTFFLRYAFHFFLFVVNWISLSLSQILETAWTTNNECRIEFTSEYPNKPPIFKFQTKMFHPNIYKDGKICLDILQNKWSPGFNISAVLTSIQSLLPDPNPDSPANPEASNMFTDDKEEYAKRVRERDAITRDKTKEHAIDSSSSNCHVACHASKRYG